MLLRSVQVFISLQPRKWLVLKEHRPPVCPYDLHWPRIISSNGHSERNSVLHCSLWCRTNKQKEDTNNSSNNIINSVFMMPLAVLSAQTLCLDEYDAGLWSCSADNFATKCGHVYFECRSPWIPLANISFYVIEITLLWWRQRTVSSAHLSLQRQFKCIHLRSDHGVDHMHWSRVCGPPKFA